MTPRRFSAVQVNHAIKLKYAADRPRLDRLIESVRRDDLEAQAIDGPLGALGLPLWTSVVFTAPHGDADAVEHVVSSRLDEAGVTDHFERWN